MDSIVERCAGLDVGKRQVQACVRVPDPGGGRRVEIKTFPTFTSGLELLADWLAREGVTEVVMEATGQYWKPVVRHEAPWNRVEVKGLHRRAVAAVR